MKKSQKQLVCLVHNDFDDLELWYPILRLAEEDINVVIAGETKGETYIGKKGLTITADIAYADIDHKSFAGVLIPGGWAPDKLRRFTEILQLIQTMNNDKKLIGQICHAPWVCISAGILQGRMVTSTPAIKDDLMNAGAHWIDKDVVIDRNIVSSRKPNDLPVYVKEIIKKLKD